MPRPDWTRAGLLGAALLVFATAPASRADPAFREEPTIKSGASWSRPLGVVRPDRRYELVASLAGPDDGDRLVVELRAPGGVVLRKELHAGDPDVYLPFRPASEGPASLQLTRPREQGPNPLRVEVSWRDDPIDDEASVALEAEPNDDWRSANPLVLGRSVYGSADDAEYLDNSHEGETGLDWFRFEVGSSEPVLVTFTLDLVDRDVSADLRVFTVEGGEPRSYVTTDDPMEIVHDRERVRYSKNLVRTFAKGTYYLRVNANHPAYILRTRVSGVPPYDDPEDAVAAGLHYILNAGDAWLAQVPREGNRFVRAANLHETSLRCTGCHATSYPAEAALSAHRAGFPVVAKDELQYLMDRIADSPTPLDGGGLYWQRYIATPLEAQGQQGGLLLDFERRVVGRESKAPERFGPFLEAAWSGRDALPDDEPNVVPAESKFSMAWRDRDVLAELARRTGREGYAKAAGRIVEIASSRVADRQVESLQDRIHRLVAWGRFDAEANANKIRRESGALIALQNEDGGWHESDVEPGPSSVYVTGQLVDALLEAGFAPDHPTIARALDFLLARQQLFGGWFQPESHETFRTPMRETRYAVMALARAFPRSAAPGATWGNRDGGAARLPRLDSLVATLDDLENLWTVPEDEAGTYAEAIAPLVAHPSPLVRASAASCLGRLSRAEGVTALANALGDPTKVVRRAAAVALRRLGSREIGLDAIAKALEGDDPRARRAATRAFAFQAGMLLERAEMVDRLIARAGDPDLLARFEAVRALRRAFYANADPTVRARIVAAFLDRLGVETLPLQRRNLSENLYIMLDENLGGGVSLRRNLAVLPGPIGESVLVGRRRVEREILLGPILAALRGGDERLRSGLLAAFDGSFLRGRTYARQPEGAVDVGNDREFGFLDEPPLDELEATFAALLAAPPGGPARRQAYQLASFFKVPGRTRDPAIQSAFLRVLADEAEDVRAEAARIVRDELALDGAEDDPTRLGLIVSLLDGSQSARGPIVAAIGRHAALANDEAIAAALRGLAGDPEAAADLLPLLDRLGPAEIVAIDAIARVWQGYDAARKAETLERLAPRIDRDDATRKPIREVFRKAIEDDSETIRERAFAALLVGGDPGDFGPPLRALADLSPRIRRLGLAATASRASFWDRADASERLAALLIDPDDGVRSDALDVVKFQRLVARRPGLAARVKALADGGPLAARAEALLRAAGLDPAAIVADASAGRPAVLDLEAFRRDVRPWFAEPGPDGHACIDCHASHSIFRLSEPRDGGPTPADVEADFASALKVVDLARPESSPLLRKPRSPRGRDDDPGASPDSPTHLGGTRWESDDHPAYRAILRWIREAAPASP